MIFSIRFHVMHSSITTAAARRLCRSRLELLPSQSVSIHILSFLLELSLCSARIHACLTRTRTHCDTLAFFAKFSAFTVTLRTLRLRCVGPKSCGWVLFLHAGALFRFGHFSGVFLTLLHEQTSLTARWLYEFAFTWIYVLALFFDCFDCHLRRKDSYAAGFDAKMARKWNISLCYVEFEFY